MADDWIELSPIEDTWVEDVAYVHNLGNVARVGYFTWEKIGGIWQKVIVKKLVRPNSSLKHGRLAQMLESRPVDGMIERAH